MIKSIVYEVFTPVMEEMERQVELWGDQRDHHPLVWSAILTEETGEVAKAAMEIQFEMVEDKRNYREELIQVAAVACSALVALNKKESKMD